MGIARVVVVLVLVALALGIGFIYSGLFDVGATWPDDPVGAWVFRTTAKHSVRRHARGIAAPSLSDPNLVATGSGLYSLQCALCHGDVGTPPGDAGKGLRPRPPELAKTAGEWSGPQLFRIVKNGTRMTGMPAWGAAYPDRDLWAIVAYTAGLPALSATARSRQEGVARPLAGYNASTRSRRGRPVAPGGGRLCFAIAATRRRTTTTAARSAGPAC